VSAVLPFLAKFLHVRRSELDRTLQVAGFAMVIGWAMYTAFNGAQAIFLTKSGPPSGRWSRCRARSRAASGSPALSA